ncbi:GNAT family N-acetyltransferase [Streptomyces sp. NPDC001761]
MVDRVRLVRVSADAPRLVWELHTQTERVAYLDARDGDLLWVSHIGVDPRYRRLGHATRLLHAVLAHAPATPVGLTAAPFPSWRQPGLLHDDLRTWYTTRLSPRAQPAGSLPHDPTRRAAWGRARRLRLRRERTHRTSGRGARAGVSRRASRCAPNDARHGQDGGPAGSRDAARQAAADGRAAAGRRPGAGLT